jgi:hypothetical protein
MYSDNASLATKTPSPIRARNRHRRFRRGSPGTKYPHTMPANAARASTLGQCCFKRSLMARIMVLCSHSLGPTLDTPDAIFSDASQVRPVDFTSGGTRGTAAGRLAGRRRGRNLPAVYPFLQKDRANTAGLPVSIIKPEPARRRCWLDMFPEAKLLECGGCPWRAALQTPRRCLQ